jgi:hypothetical protein
MQELTGDICDYQGRAVIVITTNGSLTKDGRAILGRGCARQAGERFPDLPLRLGRLIRDNGNHVQLLGDGLVSFPVEDSAWSLPDMRLIARSAAELLQLADKEGWDAIVIPRPGCGGGGLAWEEVMPLLTDCFDGRFIVMDRS